MAISQKGLRFISVDGLNYYWKFSGSVVRIYAQRSNLEQLTIGYGWISSWEFMGGPADKTDIQYKMQSITPKFVAAAIRDARSLGWNAGQLDLEYCPEKGFSVKK